MEGGRDTTLLSSGCKLQVRAGTCGDLHVVMDAAVHQVSDIRSLNRTSLCGMYRCTDILILSKRQLQVLHLQGSQAIR